MSRLCVLLPAYNEAKNIGRVVEAVRAVRIEGVEITAVVVDDGSKDATAEVAREAGATVLVHPQNRGVGAGFRTGRDWALEQGFDYFIHMDSDGQVQPHEIPLMLAPILSGEADLALGSRFVDSAPVNLRRWKALALQAMAQTIGVFTGTRLTDASCGFRCMNRRVLAEVRPTFDYDYIQETLIQAIASGARVVDVPVNILYDEEHVRAPSMSSRTFRYSRRFIALTAYSMAQFYRKRATRLFSSK